MNEGVVQHFATAAAWAARERERASFYWPSFTLEAQTGSQWPIEWIYNATLANLDSFLFYSLLAWPFIALAVLVLSRADERTAWPKARAKIGAVAALAILANAGFLRPPFGARLGDVSVPQAILLAWLLAEAIQAARFHFTAEWRGWWTSGLARTRVVVVAFALLWVPGVLIGGLPATLEQAYLLEGVEVAVERVRSTTRRYQRTFPLENWSRPNEEGPIAPGVLSPRLHEAD